MKKFLALSLALAMSLSLAACGGNGGGSSSGSGSGSTSGSGSAADGAQKIGISMPTQSLERWNRDGSYLDQQFQAAGYETIVTYSDNDTNRQVNDIQNMIAEDVDLLVVAAIDGEALNTVMNEAGEAGIPIIAYDRLIMNDNVSYYVSFDNYTVGTLQGQYIVSSPARPTLTPSPPPPGIPRPLWSALRTSWPPTMPTAPRLTPGCAPTTPPLWA